MEEYLYIIIAIFWWYFTLETQEYFKPHLYIQNSGRSILINSNPWVV